MARGRQPAQAPRRRRATNVETMRHAAGDFLSRFESLVDEVVALREALIQAQEENTQLRSELAEGVDLFRRARSIVANAERPSRRTRGGRRPATTDTPRRTGRARARSTSAPVAKRRAQANGRATPDSVTGDVVRAVIGKLGSASAAEIAAQISKAGAPVSGRANRHIAKGAGAVMRPGDDGRMVYSLS